MSWTLSEVKAQNMEVNAFCENPECRNFFVFKTDILIQEFGAGTKLDELPGFECSACGGATVFKLAFKNPNED